jgi:hypothetical protein
VRVYLTGATGFTATAAALGVELPGLDSALRRMRAELETGELAPEPQLAGRSAG